MFLLPYVGYLRFSVPLEIFFLSYWDVLQRLTYTRQLWSLSSGIGHLFIWPSLRVRDTHTWNRAFGNETVTIGHCHWISVLPIEVCRGLDSNTQPSAFEANVLINCATPAVSTLDSTKLPLRLKWTSVWWCPYALAQHFMNMWTHNCKKCQHHSSNLNRLNYSNRDYGKNVRPLLWIAYWHPKRHFHKCYMAKIIQILHKNPIINQES